MFFSPYLSQLGPMGLTSPPNPSAGMINPGMGAAPNAAPQFPAMPQQPMAHAMAPPPPSPIMQPGSAGGASGGMFGGMNPMMVAMLLHGLGGAGAGGAPVTSMMGGGNYTNLQMPQSVPMTIAR